MDDIAVYKDEEHADSELRIVKEPTCTEKGYTLHTCKDCGGKGLTESIETIEVVVPPCKAHGSTITFSKMVHSKLNTSR